MSDWARWLFSSEAFLPHGACLLWTPALLALWVLSDGLIALAYYSIPIALLSFVRQRQDLAFHWMFLLFGAFIFWCGTTHVLEVWTLWQPLYWLEGGVKAVTAAISMTTAVLLWLLLPRALALPSPAQLARSNEELSHEITMRKQVEAELRSMQEELEQRVQERTAELTQLNEQLQREIAERRQAEEKTRDLMAALERSPNAVITLDLDARITSWSLSATRLYGYEAHEVVGRIAPDFLAPQSMSEEYDRVLRRVRSEEPSLYETRRRTKTGEVLDVEIAFAPIYAEDGAVVGQLTISRNITERKRAEAEVRRLNAELEQRVRDRTAQLEAANRELEAFSYSVSHDLRAPLRAIDGFSRILSDYAAHLPEDAQYSLQRLRHNTQRMGQLIEGLLTFSRLSHQSLRKQEVAVRDMVQEVLESLHSERDGRCVEYVVGELPSCRADPALLRQIYVNLLSNALKFTRQRERARIEIGSQEHEGARVYYVKDNGVGFDMRYADKLFGVFQRLHRVEEYEGTGAGLAIVQRIIQRHGGRIWAESAVDSGATFLFTLAGRGEKRD